jgi:hypothetical protein
MRPDITWNQKYELKCVQANKMAVCLHRFCLQFVPTHDKKKYRRDYVCNT